MGKDGAAMSPFTFELHGVRVGGLAFGPADVLVPEVRQKLMPHAQDWPHLSRWRLWRLLERSSHSSVTVRSRAELMQEPWRPIVPAAFSVWLLDDSKSAEFATVAVRYRGRIYVACFIRLVAPETQEEWDRWVERLPETPAFYVELACGRLDRAVNAAILSQ